MALSGFIGVSNLKYLKLELTASDEIYAGHKSEISLLLSKSGKKVPSYLITAITEWGAFSSPVVDSQSVKGKIFITPPARGFYSLKSCVIQSTFPFNFFIRRKVIPADLNVVVFPSPKTCPVNVLTIDREQDFVKNDITALVAGGEEINRTRDYHPGDLKRSVMWKHYAKSGRLMVKVYESAEESGNIIHLEDIPGNLETRLSCATYIILKFLKENRNIGLETKKGKFPPANSHLHKLQMLRHLALYED